MEPEPLTHRFTAVRAALAASTGLPVTDVPARTAVSAAQIGLVSRFWSVALASVALHDWVPALTAGQVLVADSHRNPSAVALADPDAGCAVTSTHAAATALGELVAHGAVAAVTDACREHGRTSPTVLVSNAASALVAAARVVGGRVPGRSDDLTRVVHELLRLPWLARGGSYHAASGQGPGHPGATPELDAAPHTSPVGEPPPEEVGFRRSGCCLYYRLPGHGLCPDCVLVRPGRPADHHH